MGTKRSFMKGITKMILPCIMALTLVGGALGKEVKEPKYVFLFIGDGMAVTQRNAAEMYLGAIKNGNTRENNLPVLEKLAMDTLPVQGMCTTYSTNSLITDSAAAGTALATGQKTKSGVIAMDPSGKKSFKTIAEMAKERGQKIGIVSSVSIEHATPAVFYSHNPSRKNYYAIAYDLAQSGFDYFGGGGFKRPTGKNKDQKDIFQILKEEGYTVTKNTQDFQNLKTGTTKVVAINPVLDSSKALPYAMDAKEGISLADFTAKGIELMKDNPKGFFMMVEGGKIDWACHANDAVASIKDTIAFDDAVKVGLEFYKAHPAETLIVVTGDHETGGLTLGFATTKYETYVFELDNQKESYDVFDKTIATYRKEHTGEGKPAPRFEDMTPLVKKAFGMDMTTMKDYEIAELKRAFQRSMEGEGGSYGSNKIMSNEDYLLYGSYEPFSIALTHLLNRRAGLAWTSYSHTGVPVPVSAIGVGEQEFNGFYDNTDIFKKMVTLMNL